MVLQITVTHRIDQQTQSFIRELWEGQQPTEIVDKLNKILVDLSTIIQKENIMSANLEALRTEVAANTAVAQSAVVLINGLADRIDAAAGDEAALATLTTELRAAQVSLATAVTENTPPPVTPEPTPVPIE